MELRLRRSLRVHTVKPEKDDKNCDKNDEQYTGRAAHVKYPNGRL
jgi:hypothetical protein